MTWTKKPSADDPGDVIELDELGLIAPDAHVTEASPYDEFAVAPDTLVQLARCPNCGGIWHAMEKDAQPPATHEEAWAPGPLRDGKRQWEEGACRGNLKWGWCRAPIKYDGEGALELHDGDPGTTKARVHFYRDRRVDVRPVAVERRGLPPGTPPKR